MRVLALLVLGALATTATAQPVQSTAPDTLDRRTPRGAVTRALLLPGLGQVYNRQPVKAPVAVAIVVGAAIYAVDRQRQYIRFRRATVFAGCRAEDPSGRPGDPETSPDRFELCTEVAPDYQDEWEALGSSGFLTVRSIRDRARGQRDIGFLIVGVAYAFQALDAYVAAELADFDVSEDLSIQIRPDERGATVAARLRL